VGPGAVIMAGLFLLISYFAIYNTVAAWLFVKARELRIRNVPVLVMLFPLMWSGLEATRAFGDFSFPWSPLGMIFGQQVVWLQALAWIGVFGYSALVILANMAVAYAFLQRRWVVAVLPALILAGLWLHGNYVLSSPEAKPFYVEPGTDTLRIALVQPSIHQTKKWSRGYYDSVMQKTWSMIDTMTAEDLDLLVLPETAIPDFIRMRRGEQAHFKRYSAEKQLPVFVGALNHDRKGPPPRRYNYYNAAFLFSPDGERMEYRKVHLVPFSERLPFDDVFPLLNYVDLGEGDFTPGDSLPVLQPGGWTPLICYEAIYGDIVRRAVRGGARLIVNITNDGWFGLSTAPGQHLGLVRYRAIESGIPVARCANSGISGFIDVWGHYAETTDLFVERIVRKTLALKVRPTLYARIGDWVEIGLFTFFFVWSIVVLVWHWRIANRKGLAKRRV